MDYPATTATVETLSNGLTVILDPDNTAPVVSAQAWVETGSIHEDAHLGSGISHFLEHMVFKGTRDYSGEQLAQSVQGAGGHWNAYTTFGRTVYYIDGPADSLSEFLKCLTGLVYFPTLPEDEFEREKDVIRREIDMGLDNPDDVSLRLMLSTVFQQDPRRHPVIGQRHLFDALNYEDLCGYHRRRYTTDRSFVVISGDFDPVQVHEQLEALTDTCLPSGGNEPTIVQDPPQVGPRFARDRFAIPASKVSLSWRSPSLNDPMAPAFEILAAVLGRGRSSRLYQQLREQQSLALEISAYHWGFPGSEGLFGISAETPPDKREALISGIKEVLHTIDEEEDSDRLVSDIAKAQRQIAASQFRSLMSASGRATDLASNWHEARDLNYTRHALSSLARVGPDEVQHAASRLNERGLNLTLLDPVDAPAPQRTKRLKQERQEIVSRTLTNGIELALLPDRRVPLVQFQLAARAGVISETADNAGLNQLLAATLPKGTTSRTGEQIALELESLGASMSAASGNNALLLQAAGLAQDLQAIGEVLADVAIAPRLDEVVIKREKASQLAALKESMQEPLHRALKSLRGAAFQSAGYGVHALGSEESLRSLHRPQLLDQHYRHLAGKNLSLVVAGDFNPDATADWLEQRFAALPEGEAWQPPASQFQADQQVRESLAKKQAAIAIGFEGGTATGEERHALAFLQEYAADMAGPLFVRIREELGLAYQVGATQFLGYDSGLFTFYLATSPEQAQLARDEMLAEIAKIAAKGIPEEAFERVRSTVLSGHAIQQQSLGAIARATALDLLFGHPATAHRELEAEYRALQPAAVAEVAAKVFAAKPVIATVMPEL
ncbi:MAG: pitrilysin family protein [Akkermansiaceae bacterium]|nr:pitrilysin family protein [Akkermansiaceae bacterium]